jgi:hypothetical protein
MRGKHGMNGSEWRGSRLAVSAGDHEARDHRHPQLRLFTYCVVSGALGTATASVMSLTASGVTRIAVWAAVIGLVSLLAGLAYDSAPADALWAACRLVRRDHGDA